MTSAVGSLSSDLPVGSIGVVNGFVTVYAPGCHFGAVSLARPEDTLDPTLRKIALKNAANLWRPKSVSVMVRGPFFEGRRYDKSLLVKSGAGVVGMSILPEACVSSTLHGTRFGSLFHNQQRR